MSYYKLRRCTDRPFKNTYWGNGHEALFDRIGVDISKPIPDDYSGPTITFSMNANALQAILAGKERNPGLDENEMRVALATLVERDLRL